MLGLNAAVENHNRKHQKKPTVAMESCSTLWPRMNVCSAETNPDGLAPRSIRVRQQGACQGVAADFFANIFIATCVCWALRVVQTAQCFGSGSTAAAAQDAF